MIKFILNIRLINQHLSAFTIPDLLAAMAIGSLVMSLSMYGLTLVVKIYSNQLSTASDLYDLQLVQVGLENDNFHAKSVEMSDVTIKFERPDRNCLWIFDSQFTIAKVPFPSSIERIDSAKTVCTIKNVEYDTKSVITKIVISAKNKSLEKEIILHRPREFKKHFKNKQYEH